MAKSDIALLTTDEVAKWKDRLAASREWRKDEERKWKRYIGYAQGDFQNADDSVTVNLVHPHVRIIIPATYSKNPDIVVVARQKSAVEPARVMEQLLRYLIKELNLKGEMKLCLLDAILIGHAWMKVGYQTDFEEVMVEKKPVIQQVFENLKAMLSGKTDVEESTYHLEPDERIVAERPWAIRLSPFDVLVPAYSSNAHEMPWIDHQTIRRIQDVKACPYFKNNQSLTPSANAFQLLKDKIGANTKASARDEFDEYVVLHEIWDTTENKIYTIAEDNEDCLEVKENAYSFLDTRHCFEMLAFNTIPDKFYPLSEIQPWEEQLLELNDIRTQMRRHRRRFNRRYVYAEGDFSASALETMKNGADGSYIPSTGEDVSKSFYPVQDAALPTDVYQSEIRVKEDITNIGGITDYQRGSSAEGAKTATEASIVESQSRFRSEERLDVVGDFATAIIRKIAQISQHFMDQEQVFPIVGDDAIRWLKVDKRQIQGEFLFEIIYGSTAAVNRDVEKQQFVQAYQLMSQDPYFDPIKVRVEMIRKLGFVNPEEWMNPQIAAMLHQAHMQAIQDAMVGGGTGSNGSGGGSNPGSSPPSSSGMMGGIRRALSVITPGGIGGGRMNGASSGLNGGGGTM